MEIEKALIEYTACFTGHRVIRNADRPMMVRWLYRAIDCCIDNGICWFMCGGALGFDTLAAQTVLELRDSKYPYIRLGLALPCYDQTAHWPMVDIETYESIKTRADKVVYTSESRYFDGCMALRNRFMVDASCIVVYYQYKAWGGAAQTVNYAREQKKRLMDVMSGKFDR